MVDKLVDALLALVVRTESEGRWSERLQAELTISGLGERADHHNHLSRQEPQHGGHQHQHQVGHLH